MECRQVFAIMRCANILIRLKEVEAGERDVVVVMGADLQGGRQFMFRTQVGSFGGA